MKGTLQKIQQDLRVLASERALKSWEKSTPTATKIYGVSVADINNLVKKYYKDSSFPLVEALWNSGYLESRLLAAKLLGRICKKDPDKALELLKHWAKTITNWAVCDTLATQGIRKIARLKQTEIFKIAKQLVQSDN